MLKSIPKTFLRGAVAAFLFAIASADTIQLKSGDKVEGKIISETETELTVEIVMGGVVDERKIPKAEIASVSKVAPDEVAWQPLKGYALFNDSLPTVDQYDAYIGPLKSFIAEFGSSKYKAEAEQKLAEFEAEKKRVVDGEVKLKGLWLSKEEVQKERYQVNAAIAANYMTTQATRGDLIGAMNTFELLGKQYPGSRGYVEAHDLALRVASRLKGDSTRRLAALPAENAARQKGVKAAAGLEQIQLRQELETEKKNIELALATAKKQGQKWPPFLARSEEAMKQIQKLAEEAERKVASFDRNKATRSLDLAEQAKADLEANELADAESKLKEAQTLWSQNEMSTRLSKDLVAAKAAAKEREEAARAAATPEPVKATPTPKPTPVKVAAEREKEESEVNWLFVGVGGVLFAVLAFVGWKAYMRVRKKANEIIA